MESQRLRQSRKVKTSFARDEMPGRRAVAVDAVNDLQAFPASGEELVQRFTVQAEWGESGHRFRTVLLSERKSLPPGRQCVDERRFLRSERFQHAGNLFGRGIATDLCQTVETEFPRPADVGVERAQTKFTAVRIDLLLILLHPG
jgi:hypothetical protein